MFLEKCKRETTKNAGLVAEFKYLKKSLEASNFDKQYL
jgi:hypothetical protein